MESIESIPYLSSLPWRISKNDQNLNAYLRLRLNHGSFLQRFASPAPTIWYYTGVLRNPATGKEVAGIEGLEMIMYLSDRGLASSSHPSLKNVTNPEKIHHYMSKKLFVYTDNSNHSQPLLYNRPPNTGLGRRRRVIDNTKEFHEIVSIASDDREGSYQMTIQWPGGRVISTNKVQINSISDDRSRLDITNFISAGTRPTHRKHWWTRWISFSSPISDLSGRSQEYYSVFPLTRKESKKSRVGMTYKRWGEAPSWFALGRTCSTELRAFRVDSIRKIKPWLNSMCE